MVLLPAAKALIWQKWDDLYLVYQPSSAETHVFNETSALILASIERGPRPLASVREWTADRLGLSADDLVPEEFDLAVTRLEELGLLDRGDDTIAAE
ncbi:MAG: HPr-rel-A system PqqD family peptide chaperone [Candidatus Accumulibacter sp.]|nr:HPr-rel-A system PqqD family peptide chaperone [Accumulibacter sp.]